jgi:ankyrin repeat protein
VEINGIDGYELQELEEFYMTPLRLAVDLNDVPLARHLLEKGAKAQYREGTRGQFSPMHAARSAEMVQLLLDHNADPELVNDINRRSLQWYVIRDEIAAMRSILQHGAKVNLNTRYEQPLHEAALHNLPAVQPLVEHGADLEQKDFDMNTPLHFAAKADLPTVQGLYGWEV